MKFLNDIKCMLGERKLKRKEESKRKPAVANFGRAKSVGILYREKGEGFFILVKQYVKYLKAEQGIRDVLALCYIDDHKAVPHYHLHRLRFDYFTDKELNFFMEPVCEQVNKFIANDFDILIDLEKDPSLPMRFVLQASQARFKVGYYAEEYEYLYDMMLKTGEQATFDQYIQQVNHYLNIIDTNDARA